ncbi:THUMP domain-containing protein [Empedobacter brevis]|nr:THUMP domain-containing protein [Empedobacter brevis]
MRKPFIGFEDILMQEIKTLGAADVKIQKRMVEFYGDLGFMYKVNYGLRTALRIQQPILTFSAKNNHQFTLRIRIMRRLK